MHTSLKHSNDKTKLNIIIKQKKKNIKTDLLLIQLILPTNLKHVFGTSVQTSRFRVIQMYTYII